MKYLDQTVGTICITVLIILCVGEPDLLDALIAYISKG